MKKFTDKTKLYLLRHGEVANAQERIFNGHYDVKLSQEGFRQCKEVALKLKNINFKAVYSSDLQRASVGADIIARYHSQNVTKYQELRELNYGKWEGVKVDDVLTTDKIEMQKRYTNLLHHRIEGGETLIEMNKRVIAKVEKLLKKHLGDTILIVAHGGVNRLIILWALSCGVESFYRIKQEYAALNIINYYKNGNMEIELLNSILYKKSSI